MKTDLTKKELLLVANLLEMAGDQFSNHGCNDLPDDFWDGWTIEERQKLIADAYEQNHEPEEAKEGHSDIQDDFLMWYFCARIRFICS